MAITVTGNASIFASAGFGFGHASLLSINHDFGLFQVPSGPTCRKKMHLRRDVRADADEEVAAMGSIVLLDLMGGVALLLWGLHMVLSGVLRAFGPDLRWLLGKALGNRFSAFAAGLGLTALLQSSTATGLMTTSLAADGVVNLVPAVAIMLGANVGTTLIVQLLSFDIAAIAPVLFVIGLVIFRVGGSSLARAIGRIAIGLGLTLLALHILLDTLAPAEQAPVVRTILASITGDPVLCIIIAGALTWAAHSSVAVVLLIM